MLQSLSPQLGQAVAQSSHTLQKQRSQKKVTTIKLLLSHDVQNDRLHILHVKKMSSLTLLCLHKQQLLDPNNLDFFDFLLVATGVTVALMGVTMFWVFAVGGVGVVVDRVVGVGVVGVVDVDVVGVVDEPSRRRFIMGGTSPKSLSVIESDGGWCFCRCPCCCLSWRCC
jgi:hypothetical protein